MTSEILVRKKRTTDHIVAHINNWAATNWDLESVKSCLNEMAAKGIISESYKPLTIFATKDTSSQNNEQIYFPETTTPLSRIS